MQNDRTFRFGRSSETPLGYPAIDEVSDGAHHARQSDYFLSIFFFFDFFLLAMAAILVRVELRGWVLRLSPPTVKTALHGMSQGANEKWKKLLFFRSLTAIQLAINRRSGI